MKKTDRTKLELVRIEGICRLVLEKTENIEDLRNKIENLKKANVRDVKSALLKLNRYELIKIIDSMSNITSKDINDIYEQYRYGLKPGFTIFYFNKKSKKIPLKDVEEKIKEYIKKISYAEEANYKDIKYKSYTKIDEDVYEYAFTYLSKYTYISDKEEPDYIYEMQESYIWFSLEHMFLAIKNSPRKIETELKNIFENIYEINLYNIKINKKLIKEVFDDTSMKKGSFIKLDAGDDEAEKMIIADANFSEKDGLKAKVSGYDMTSTFLNEKIDENTNSTLGINCNVGKLYLTKNVTATIFRRWSVNKIKAIISYLNNFDNFIDFETFKSKNIMADDMWSNYNNNQKNLIEEIIYSIYISLINKKDNILLTNNILKFNEKLNKDFYTRFTYECNKCQEMFFPRCDCGSANLVLIGNKIMCQSCGKEAQEVECEEGHNIVIDDIQNILNLVPRNELNTKIANTLLKNFNVNFEDSFFINANNLTIIKKQTGGLLTLEDVKEFKKIKDIKLSIEEEQKLMERFKKIDEKCKKSNNKECISCLSNDSKNCIMKIFTTYDDYRPSPHQAQEFGDVNFKINLYTGENLQFVGIAKSSTNKDVLNLSDNSSRELLQQILTMTHDKRVNVIGAICPMKFHDQLIKEIEYLSAISKVKMIILDDRFMIRQLKEYDEKKGIEIPFFYIKLISFSTK